MDKRVLTNIIAGGSVRKSLMESPAKKRINTSLLEKELKKAIFDFMVAEGFDPEDVDKYSGVTIKNEPDRVLINVGAELSFDGCMSLSDELDKVLSKFDKDAYFDIEEPGLLVASIEK